MTRFHSISQLIAPIALLIGLDCFIFNVTAEAIEEDVSRVDRKNMLQDRFNVGGFSAVNRDMRLFEAAAARPLRAVGSPIALSTLSRVQSAETMSGGIGKADFHQKIGLFSGHAELFLALVVPH